MRLPIPPLSHEFYESASKYFASFRQSRKQLGLCQDQNTAVAVAALAGVPAAAFGQARIEIVRDAGHLPQIEQPAATFALVDDYVRDPGDRVES